METSNAYIGGLWVKSFLGYAVRDFFINGGSQAIIVRLYHPEKDGTSSVKERAIISLDGLSLEAIYPGRWGLNLRVSFDVDVSQEVADRMGFSSKESLFNITIRDVSPGGITERILNVSVEDGPRRIDKVLADESKLMRWSVIGLRKRWI